MRILQSIDRVVDKGLDRLTVSLINVLLFLMAVVIFIEVVTRYLFGFAHGQVQEYCVLFFMWVVFIMVGKVTREKKHIIIGLLPESLVRAGRLRAKAALDIYVSLTFLAFAAMFIYFGVLDTIVYIKTGYCGTLRYVPQYWAWHLALPVGAVLLLYYGARELIQNIRLFTQLKHGEEIKSR